MRFTDEFPMTVTGKVQKFKMREVSIAELGLETIAGTPMPRDVHLRGIAAERTLRVVRARNLDRVPSRPMHVDAIFSAIGRFCARFWWIVIPAWLVAALVLSAALPQLSSVTQGNNTKFLPASAPSMHAATLAEPFGTSNLQPVPVVVARTSAPLTAADVSAIGALTAQFRQVPTVNEIKDLGRSPDGHAEQLVVLARFSGGQNQDTTW